MNDFFGRLEGQLRDAAERRPRRGLSVRDATPAIAAALAAVAALVPLLVILGRDDDGDVAAPESVRPAPVGTVIPKGEGDPPRGADSLVVANGRTPIGGPWQLEVHRGSGVKNPETGKVYLRAGGDCLTLVLLDPPDARGSRGGGFCSPNRRLGFRRTPGFSRQQHSVTTGELAPDGRHLKVAEVIVFGVVPERAAAVMLTAPGTFRRIEIREGPRGQRRDFYVAPIRPSLRRGWINWVDRRGNPGSRGIRLLPPLD